MIRCSTASLRRLARLSLRPPEFFITMDRLTAEDRSWNMSRIKGRDTGPERRVRSLLHRLGFRFSLRRKDLPGRPDIVLPMRGVAVFVHGCFWHRHEKCRNSVLPKTRPEFWLAKLSRNVERDQQNAFALKQLGWRVLTIWECELENEPILTKKLRRAMTQEGHG
jgi:DNA mismatch endonuclease, patch repair protein